MTTISIIMLTIAAWGQRLVGGFLVGPLLEKRPMLARAAGLIPAAIVMAVIVQLTFGSGKSIVIDERFAGMVVAALLVWRKAPFIVVVVAAALVTAGLRAFT